MSIWRITVPLCLHGLFREYRPNEPFITAYLVGPWKNLTREEINQEIYPLGTYFTLAILILVFLLTDFLRYKPVIVMGGFSGVACWTLWRFGPNLASMQATQIFYALFDASEIGYLTYIYAKVGKDLYQQVTSYTRIAILLGKAAAGLSAQLLVLYNIMDYEQLNYLTILGVGLSAISALALPSVETSVYFHRQISPDHVANGDPKENVALKPIEGVAEGCAKELNREYDLSNTSKYKLAIKYLCDDFLDAFTNPHVVKWSIWWALATCGHLQVHTYVQMLWTDINDGKKDKLLNGYVEFGYSIAACFVAFCVGQIRLPWSTYGELFLAVVSLLQGVILFYSGFTHSLILAYAFHMSYGLLYQSAITIASSEVAKFIREDSYALVFGVNFFIALLLQTILTSVVNKGVQADIRPQFLIYGGIHLIMGMGFVIAGIITFIRRRR